MYYVYILKNHITNEIYIGCTNDLRRRYKEHKYKKPELIYYEAYKSEKDARHRESNLKLRSRALAQLKKRIQESLK